jgi:hypothetical protein
VRGMRGLPPIGRPSTNQQTTPHHNPPQTPHPKPNNSFYPLFGQLSSIAPIIAGQVVARVAEKGDFGASLRVLTILTTICGVGIVGLYKYCSVAVQREADAGCVRAGGRVDGCWCHVSLSLL